MTEHDIHNIEPGMEVYDSAGHEIGTVARVYRQVYLPASGTESAAALTGEDMVDVKTTGFLGLGVNLHLHLRDVKAAMGHTLVLTRSLAELKEAEQRHPPAPPEAPQEQPLGLGDNLRVQLSAIETVMDDTPA